MGVMKGWIGAHAYEFLRADLDEGDAGIVVKMGNDMVGHRIHLGQHGRGTQTTRRRMLEMQRTILAEAGGFHDPRTLPPPAKLCQKFRSPTTPPFSWERWFPQGS